MAKNRHPVREKTLLSVWKAEDGRCEVCKRPMDKRLARWLPRKEKIKNNPSDIHLACLDCSKGRPDYLLTFIRVDKNVAKKLKKKLGFYDEREFLDWLRNYGVLVGANPEFRRYWIPGIGVFFLKTLDQTENGLPVRLVYKAKRIYPDPKLIVKEQKRTRGFPRPAIKV
jgi:hypothetical protein